MQTDLAREYMFSHGKRMLLIAWTHRGTFALVSINFILRESSHVPKMHGRNVLKVGDLQ